MHSDIHDIINKLSLPIKNPLSMDEVQCEHEYDQVEKEFQKLQGVLPVQPDWEIVVKNSMIILTEQARHLKIVTYLFVALYKLYSLDGLLGSMYLLAEILEVEGDNILPNNKRKKSRDLRWKLKIIFEN